VWQISPDPCHLLLSINSIGEKNGCAHYFAASQQKHRYNWDHLLLHSLAKPNPVDVSLQVVSSTSQMVVSSP
jgi:hypothetical protein